MEPRTVSWQAPQVFLGSLNYGLLVAWAGEKQWQEGKVKVAASRPTLCDPTDWILQARILEWVAFPFSRGSSQPRDRTQASRIVGRFFYQLSHKGNPRVLEWVAYPFCSGSSQPRNPTGVSCIVGGFFTELSGEPRKRARNVPICSYALHHWSSDTWAPTI